jgi:hypothetical protein
LPTISTFYGILIHMYWQEHHPPHFHALYGDFEALIDIQTLEIIRGDLPRRALALVQDWGLLYCNELMEDWNLCQTRQHPNKIPPLE